MAQTFNLSRGTKFYVSTVSGGWTNSNTFRVNVLDGYTFSQDVSTQEVGLNEAGPAPVRGQRVFNTAVNPAQFSITTYMRPFFASAVHNSVEKLLWEALVGAGPVNTNAVPGADFFKVDFEQSDVHELLPLYMYFELDNTTYRLDRAIVNSATIDFNIDSIAQITWTGQAEAITATTAPTTFLDVDAGADYIKNKLSTITLKDNAGTTHGKQIITYTSPIDELAACGLSNGTTYTATFAIDGGAGQVVSWNPPANSTFQDLIDEINRQLNGATIDTNASGNLEVTSQTTGTTSIVDITDGVGDSLFGDTTNFSAISAKVDGTGTATAYRLALTGGSLALENNVTFLTPEELGVVNYTIGSFTGTRKVSGNITAYLRTGSANTAGLLADMVAATSTVTHDFSMTVAIGGEGNAPRVEFYMPHAHLVIPATQVQDVISVDIKFTGLGLDISKKDEIEIKYFATP